MDMLRKLFFLPEDASAQGFQIDQMIYLIHFLMIILFIGWGIFFVVALIKFRKGKNPKANYQGVHSHTSSYIEAGVAIFEAVLLIGFSIPFWAKQVNALPQRSDAIEIRVVAEQFAWNVHYPGKDGVFGKTSLEFFDKQSNPLGIDPSDPHGKDDIVTINQMHLPIGHPAIVHLSSKDVMHSFGIPLMRVKQDVIPGMSIPTWFTPTKLGKYEIVCSQLCGIGHYRMKGFVTVETDEDFRNWYDQESASAGGDEESTDDFWN